MKNKNFTEKLFNEHSDYIRKLCEYKLQSSPNSVDDCVQEVFLALVEAVEKGVKIDYPKAWLTRVAMNKINDIYKSEIRNREQITPLNNERAQSYTISDIEVDEDEVEKIIDNILSSLTPYEKTLIQKFYTEKRRQKEIAEDLGISENTLRQQLFRLKRKILNEIKNICGDLH